MGIKTKYTRYVTDHVCFCEEYKEEYDIFHTDFHGKIKKKNTQNFWGTKTLYR